MGLDAIPSDVFLYAASLWPRTFAFCFAKQFETGLPQRGNRMTVFSGVGISKNGDSIRDGHEGALACFEK